MLVCCVQDFDKKEAYYVDVKTTDEMTLNDVLDQVREHVDSSEVLSREKNFFYSLDTFRTFDDIGDQSEHFVYDPAGHEFTKAEAKKTLQELHLDHVPMISAYNHFVFQQFS